MFDDTQIDSYSTKLGGLDGNVMKATIGQITAQYLLSNWAVLTVIVIVSFYSLVTLIRL